MATVEFYLSMDDTERLFYLKNCVDKKVELTGNEYAAELLENVLHAKCPFVPETDEKGEYIPFKQ